MAVTRSEMALLAYGNGNKLWFLSTNDTAATVDTADYFLTMIDDIQLGDLIFAHVDKDGTPGFGVFACTGNNGTAIDVADLINFAGTDTD